MRTPILRRVALAAVIALSAVALGRERAAALPQRTLVARPLPPAVLAAAGERDSTGTTQLTAEAARRLCDSLLTSVGALRGLRPLRPVPVQAASRAQIRTRLEQITREDGIETNLRQEEMLFRYLGLVPPGLDLVQLYHQLLEEQLAGFYDIDKRELVLADWLSPAQLAPVATHELAHALQDQHFSLRVRKRLGFESQDAESAWHALIEGDASAVVAERELQSVGLHFPALVDSNSKLAVTMPAVRALAAGFESERFRAAPPVVREDLAFPYEHGLRYVASLYRNGGWRAVDDAYVHPPASSEQILHPERMSNLKDVPVRITIPDLRGLLGESYQPVSSGVLGEHSLYAYLAHYIDPEVARVSVEGWGGCSYALYTGAEKDVPLFVLVSVWDSDDDAVEFFGGIIGALEGRYPNQQGDAETSTQDQVIWRVDPSGNHVNMLKLEGRRVLCLEGMPEPRLARATAKLENVVIDDPAPEMRAHDKANLVWNRTVAPLAAGALTPRIALPAGWTRLEPAPDSLAIFAARKGDARLALCVDRTASNELGLDGYAHQIAARLQAHGRNAYVQTDIDYPRAGARMYQHIFTQTEGTREFVYCIGVFSLGQGVGYLQLWGADDGGSTQALSDLFYSLLQSMEIVPEAGPAPAPAPGGSSAGAPPHP